MLILLIKETGFSMFVKSCMFVFVYTPPHPPSPHIISGRPGSASINNVGAGGSEGPGCEYRNYKRPFNLYSISGIKYGLTISDSIGIDCFHIDIRH